MNLTLYRYGEAVGLPGLSVGVARYAPRGVSREDYRVGGYFDVALPLLAPSRELLAAYREGDLSEVGFARSYRREMRQPAARQAMRLVAAVAQTQQVNLGCACDDETRCHRAILRDLIRREASALPPTESERSVFASPACSMSEIVD